MTTLSAGFHFICFTFFSVHLAEKEAEKEVFHIRHSLASGRTLKTHAKIVCRYLLILALEKINN